MEYFPTIGLEIHAELKTKSKMFCSCLNYPEETTPNVNICPICLGHPGTLPAANADAVQKVRLVGLALNSQVLSYSKFDRKNYFYPDLPKGYQISQYDLPLCLGGELAVDINGKKIIHITRVHLEEDTAKLIHPANDDCSLVDFNRAGVPLMELVTEPDISSAEEARAFAAQLQLILRYLDASSADMEKGKMRVEVNISLGAVDSNGRKKLGTKVEIKNLNSLKAVENAIACEIKRQTDLLEEGKAIVQETRGWDDIKGITYSQREKEEAFDYRYFPEPDIPPLVITDKEIEKLKSFLPELPAQKRVRFALEYHLEPSIIEIFASDLELANYFENAMSELEEWVNTVEGDSINNPDETKSLAKLCANYLVSDVKGLLGGEFHADNFKISAENFAEFIKLIYKKEITSKVAKTVLAQMVASGIDPSNIIQNMGLTQVSDEAAISAIIDKVIADNNRAVSDYQSGKTNALQFLVGQVIAASRGKANPDVVRSLLKQRLGTQ